MESDKNILKTFSSILFENYFGLQIGNKSTNNEQKG